MFTISILAAYLLRLPAALFWSGQVLFIATLGSYLSQVRGKLEPALDPFFMAVSSKYHSTQESRYLNVT